MGNARPLEFSHSSYDENGKTAVVNAPQGQQLALYVAKVSNLSGDENDCGVARKLDNGSWKFWKLDDSDTPDATDNTSTIQAGTSVTLFEATNDGFLVQADRPFNMIGLTVGTAETGSPVYSYEFYNGSSYETLTTIDTFDLSGTGDSVAAFLAPHDWAAGTTAAVGGDSDKYSIRVRSTTAPSTAVVISSLWVGQFLAYQEALADNGYLEVVYDDERPMIFESGEGVLPYFKTANASNHVNVQYTVLG